MSDTPQTDDKVNIWRNLNKREVIDSASDFARQLELGSQQGRDKLTKITEKLCVSVWLYGPSHGRDLWNDIWDCLRVINPDVSDEWCETIRKSVCEKDGIKS